MSIRRPAWPDGTSEIASSLEVSPHTVDMCQFQQFLIVTSGMLEFKNAHRNLHEARESSLVRKARQAMIP